MSTLSPVRLCWTAVVCLSVVALAASAPVLGAPKPDKKSSRPEAKQISRKAVQSEQPANSTLRRTSTEKVKGSKGSVSAKKMRAQKGHGASVKGIGHSRQPSRHASSRRVDRGTLASRGYFSGRRTLTMRATAYDPSPGSNGGSRSGRGATGLRIGYGLAAVDPNYIPLGTRLYIEGYGHAVAGDTGGSIRGNRIDLGFDSKADANRFGTRTVVVHILD